MNGLMWIQIRAGSRTGNPSCPFRCRPHPLCRPSCLAPQKCCPSSQQRGSQPAGSEVLSVRQLNDKVCLLQAKGCFMTGSLSLWLRRGTMLPKRSFQRREVMRQHSESVQPSICVQDLPAENLIPGGHLVFRVFGHGYGG